MTTTIFEKEYCYEGLYDLERDISEAIGDEEAMQELPADGNGMIPGVFKVTITWAPDDNA